MKQHTLYVKVSVAGQEPQVLARPLVYTPEDLEDSDMTWNEYLKEEAEDLISRMVNYSFESQEDSDE